MWSLKYSEATISGLHERLIPGIATSVQQENDSWRLQQAGLFQVIEGGVLFQNQTFPNALKISESSVCVENLNALARKKLNELGNAE